jgi:hypothetical protein
MPYQNEKAVKHVSLKTGIERKLGNLNGKR